MTDASYLLFTDGACRGNPGIGGAGAVLMDGRGEVLATGKKYLGHCTNNIAEYEALILGVEEALNRRCLRLQIRLDSELLVKQIRRIQSQESAPEGPDGESSAIAFEAGNVYDSAHRERGERSGGCTGQRGHR